MMEGLLQLPVLLFSIVFHECAHGLVASWRGDDTARLQGRITLNPGAHVDLFGTIIFPLLLLVTRAGFLFGWAKPVPVNPYNLKKPRQDHILVSVAGPGSNILLGIAFAFLYVIITFFTFRVHGGPTAMGNFLFVAQKMAYFGIHINALLAAFNIIPIPPLDGSWVLYRLLPPELADRYEAIFPYGFIILMLLMMSGMISTLMSPFYHLAWGIIGGAGNLLAALFM